MHAHTQYDLIGITETWLSSDIQDPEIALPGLNLLRQDRPSKGGGVALYYRKDIQCEPLETPDFLVEDALFCTLTLNNKDKCLIAVIYRAPNSDSDHDMKLTAALQTATKGRYTHLLILGDFNFPTLLNHSLNGNPLKALLNNLLTTGTLYNHVTQPTRYRGTTNPSLLDLVLTNEELMIETIEYGAPLGASDHICLSFEFVYYASLPRRQTENTRTIIDQTRLAELAQIEDWTFLTKLPANEAWDTLLKRIEHLIKSASSLIHTRPRDEGTVKIRSRTRKWFHERNRAWRTYKSIPNTTNWREYADIRNHCTQLVREDKRRWQGRLTERLKANPKLLYKYVNSLRKVQHGLPSLEGPNGLTITLEESVNTLLLQFTNTSHG